MPTCPSSSETLRYPSTSLEGVILSIRLHILLMRGHPLTGNISGEKRVHGLTIGVAPYADITVVDKSTMV